VTTTNQFRLDHPEFAQNLKSALEFYTRFFSPFDLFPDDVVHTIRIFQASTHGFIQAEQAGLFVFSPVDESYERMVNTLIDGLVQQQIKHCRTRKRKPDA